MKNLVLLIIPFALLLTVNSHCQEIPNGDFEIVEIDDSPPAYIPYWRPLLFATQCWPIETTQDISEDSHSGNYAIKMRTSVCNGGEGLIKAGYQTGTSGEWPPLSTSIEFSERPDELNFFYKFLQEGNDSAYVEAFLFKYDSTPDIPWVERYDTIAFSSARIGEEVSEYNFFSLPINYVSDLMPDYIKIVFATKDGSCNSTTCSLGTTLWIDDVGVSGGTLGIKEEEIGATIEIYPNPAKESFQLKLKPGVTVDQMFIYDQTGRMVKHWNETDEVFQVGEFPAGAYFITIHSAQGIVTKKLMKVD